MKHTVLFVDDEPEVTEGLKRNLHKEPYRILCSNHTDEALQILETENVDLVVSDEEMPGMKGTEFLALVRKKYPETIRMMLTGHASLDSAIKAINEGRVYRLLTKPCNDMDLAVTIREALRQKELIKESYQLLQKSKRQSSIIEQMKRNRPELLEIERDEQGAILMDDSTEELDAEKLINLIVEQNKKNIVKEKV